MLDISKSERYLILSFLAFILLCAGLSYYKKIQPASGPQAFDITKDNYSININTAPPRELERLPGIGPVLACDIVAYRKEAGSFRSIEKLKDVKGIGDKKFTKIKDLITTGE